MNNFLFLRNYVQSCIITQDVLDHQESGTKTGNMLIDSAQTISLRIKNRRMKATHHAEKTYDRSTLPLPARQNDIVPDRKDLKWSEGPVVLL